MPDRLWSWAALAALSLAGAASAQTPPIRLQLPIDCRLGQTCFVQQYPDHDPGPGAKDYRCGPLTYDGHDGTDIRLPTIAAQKAGVNVLAAAAGTVRGARDGMEDISVDLAGRASVAGRECGNGVVISHPDGWETQYCHMAKGSLRVRPGQAVITGQSLGQVGESGDAAFPHVHFSVRRGTEKIDPFAFGAAPGACDAGSSLWSPDAARALAYRSPELINWGFVDGPVTMDEIESGRALARPPSTGSSAMVVYVRAIGLHKDDVLALELSGPGAAAATQPLVLDHDKAQYMLFTGARRKSPVWGPGVYRARFTARRAGVAVLERSFELRF